MTSDEVDVIVGSDHQIFSIHKQLLALYSRYFKGLFVDKPEPEIFSVHLLGIEACFFVEFNHWLYTGKCMEYLLGPWNAGVRAASLVELWKLGNFLEAPAFQNQCMRELM